MKFISGKPFLRKTTKYVDYIVYGKSDFTGNKFYFHLFVTFFIIGIQKNR